MQYTITQGDCLDVLKTWTSNTYDSLVTDPPAGIHFMGQEWDSNKGGRVQWIEWLTRVMQDCNRVLKPGAHAFVWALPRTSHWTATAIEQAGFEVRDVITHIFGTGFPKSHDISKAIDRAAGAERLVVGPDPYASNHPNPRGKAVGQNYGSDLDPARPVTAPATDEARHWAGWGTALKPASEHWILARKPLAARTVAGNVLEWETGGLNLDACRIGGEPWGKCRTGTGFASTKFFTEGEKTVYDIKPHDRGRFPANLVCSDPVLLGDEARFFYCPSKILCDPKTIIEAWKTNNVNTAGGNSCLSNQAVDSVLRNVVTSASRGAMRLREWKARFTTVTETQLLMTCETVIELIHITASNAWHEQQHADNTRLLNLAKSAIDLMQTGITTITISLPRLDGFVVVVTLENTLNNTGHGAADLPARLIYCPKASRMERNNGCELLPLKDASNDDNAFHAKPGRARTPQAAIGGARVRLERGEPPVIPRPNNHPTVKAVDLMRYLVRMITPPGGLVLDPFAGSGSTGVAALQEGFRFHGIELSADYCTIAEARLKVAGPQPR